VAGGWVRDKLMGKESDDIDIALDDMFGEEFAEMIRQKIYQDDVAAGKIDPSKQKEGKNYGVIKANSDKSKHLETAVIKVQGVFIDLVNLRSEEYAEDSRVPIVKIGTPEQDAVRRDLTINSLFYNINT
jgi:tRNA nucleotidyltransferase (CCA-adding enzyme)